MTSIYVQQIAKTPHRSRRELAIDDVSQTSTTSAWYYRVNVSVYEEVRVSTFIDDDLSDDDSSEDDRSSTDSVLMTDVEHYSILRRYSDFQQLYEQIRDLISTKEGNADTLPSFPAKEFISPALKCMLRRKSSSKVVLDDRSAKFEDLLQWIESHPVGRTCQAFLKFIGKPPQSHDGYVSLKEYTPSDWLSSLQQATKDAESRRRRYSTGNSAAQAHRERSVSEVSEGLASFQHQAIRETLSMRGSYGYSNRFSI
ncbi:hypothetical protein P3T76_008726 [Phytophthora citrophthora]|uniref:PX domain-containing protein n=1 Tax=Phytophthora citrophthora TaxID=4793 RepID=A0AAD9GIZ1_9STRA|nr:hypothetical protein P3T76_008726 [Phytophthora citrophthora]